MENNGSLIFEGLNSVQREAVSCTEGPVLIVAGAGSGKTRVLTTRIAYLLEQGKDPHRIMALTFTKKAADEMKERIAVMVGRNRARQLRMGTFHSVFSVFLREFAELIGYPQQFTIYDRNDTETMIKTCLKELGLADDKTYKPRDVHSRISKAKNNLITSDAYRNNAQILAADVAAKRSKICDIYSLYDQKCRQAGVMDFDDLLLNMNILFKQHPEVVEAIAERFDYLMVDEYQDTNVSQYIILKKLSQFHQNICVVGDDSQSIYAFRGARIENILNFSKDYPKAKVFRLEQNYRSTQVIVNAANSVIERNSDRIPKKCYSKGDEGEKINLIRAYSAEEEGTLIVSEIMSLLRSERAEYQDFAILYRTNSQSRALEEALRKRNVPYLIYKGSSFFDTEEIRLFMSYCKFVCNIADDESLRKIINRPARGIGDTSTAALNAAAHGEQTGLFKAAYLENLEQYGLKPKAIEKIRAFCNMMGKYALRVQNEDAYTVACGLAVDSGIIAMYKAEDSIEAKTRLSNLEELLNNVKNFIDEKHSQYVEEMQADGKIQDGDEIADSELPLVTLPEFLEEMALISTVDMESGEDANNKVTLMTVHTAKGLEFPYVFVAGMEENLFPSGGSYATPNEIEEERRLFYVAMTRAKKLLSLSFCSSRMRNGQYESNEPSRFVKEIDRQYIANPLRDDEVGSASSDFGWGRKYGSQSQGPQEYDRRRSAAGARPFGASSSVRPVFGSGSVQRGASSDSGHGGSFGSGVQRNNAFRQGSEVVSKPTVTTRPLNPVSKPVPRRSVDPAFVASPISALQEGQRIEHSNFGFGVIDSIFGAPADRRAKITFDDYGEKTIILRFAKIRIV